MGLHRAQHLRRHAGAAGRLGDRGLLRVPRAVSGARGLARGALHRAAGSWPRAVAAAARLDARRVGAQLVFTGFPWLSLGYAQLRARRRDAACRVRAGRRRVRWSRSPVALVAAAVARAPFAAHRRAARGARVALRSRRSRRWSPAAARSSTASSGRSPPARRSPSRWCRATSRRTSSSTRAFRERHFELYAELVARAAAGSSCCRRARSRCSPTRCPTRCCCTCCALPARATATCWSACSPPNRRLPGGRPALLQQRAVARRSRPAALPQAPSGPVRRDDSRSTRCSAGSSAACSSIPLADQTAGAARPAAARGRRPARRGQHLLRGRVRRGHPRRRPRPRRCSSTSPTTPGTAARSPPAAQPDRGDARAGDRPAAAARDQHRHHLGDRPRGRELARLPWFTRGILEVTSAAGSGVTPYVRSGTRCALVAGRCSSPPPRCRSARAARGRRDRSRRRAARSAGRRYRRGPARQRGAALR